MGKALTTTTSDTKSASTKFAAAMARIADLQVMEDTYRDRELAMLASGAKFDVEDSLATATAAAAEALAATGELPKQKQNGKSPIHEIVRTRSAIKLALEIARSNADSLRLDAARERHDARQADLRKVGAKMVEAIFTLDRALRERDALVNEIGSPGGHAWN